MGCDSQFDESIIGVEYYCQCGMKWETKREAQECYQSHQNNAGVAQSEEQLIRNEKIEGSNPSSSSIVLDSQRRPMCSVCGLPIYRSVFNKTGYTHADPSTGRAPKASCADAPSPLMTDDTNKEITGFNEHQREIIGRIVSHRIVIEDCRKEIAMERASCIAAKAVWEKAQEKTSNKISNLEMDLDIRIGLLKDSEDELRRTILEEAIVGKVPPPRKSESIPEEEEELEQENIGREG